MVCQSFPRICSALTCSLLLAGWASAAYTNFTHPQSFYHSRPDIKPPAMTITVSHPDLWDPGYVFITPYQQPQGGPYIFDKYGNLVWSGYAQIGPFNVHDMYVCEYKGADHLCMFHGNQHFGYGRGHGVIVDQNYKTVKTVQSVGITPLDQHEFKLIEGGQTALITAYQQVQHDLSDMGVDGMGWVMNSIFQVINVEDNSLKFEWNALDHFDIKDSYVYPGKSDIAGNGKESDHPWDWFHINSIDKSKLTGHYLISARHMSAIYYINGEDGTVLWTLEAGGRSDFICEDFNFTFQHDAQIREENSTTMLISFFDNSSNNANKTAVHSTGKYVKLDFETRKASLYRPMTAYPEESDPDLVHTLKKHVLCASQGNLQHLSNGNTMHGWGDWPRFSEHLPNGTAVWAAHIGPHQGKNMVYRTFSSPWKSVPEVGSPALWTYSESPNSITSFYVSWNGCTETAAWKFYGANDPRDTFSLIGKTDRLGFETHYESEIHFAYSYAEAVDKDGNSLRTSRMVRTFIPSPKLAEHCNKYNCQFPADDRASAMSKSGSRKGPFGGGPSFPRVRLPRSGLGKATSAFGIVLLLVSLAWMTLYGGGRRMASGIALGIGCLLGSLTGRRPRRRPGHVVSASKSNGGIGLMSRWRNKGGGYAVV